jgi:anti-sigma B factor antagonist
VTLADLQCEELEGVLVAVVVGEVDAANAEGLRTSLEQRLDNHGPGVVLDLSQAGYLDSTGVHMLFRLTAGLESRGQELALVLGEGSVVADTLRYADALSQFTVEPTREQAVAGLVARH